MQEKLYWFSLLSWNKPFEIQECKVLKETEKTFVIDGGHFCFVSRVNKSEMCSNSERFFLDKESAIQGRKECLNSLIERANRDIERAKKNIEVYEKLLSE